MNIYIDPREEPYSVAPRFCFLLPASLVKSEIDHMRIGSCPLGNLNEMIPMPSIGPRHHTSIYVGRVTGIYYQIGLVQEYLCTLLPNALLTFDSTRIPFVANSQCTQTNHKGIIKKGKDVNIAGKRAGYHG